MTDVVASESERVVVQTADDLYSAGAESLERVRLQILSDATLRPAARTPRRRVSTRAPRRAPDRSSHGRRALDALSRGDRSRASFLLSSARRRGDVDTTRKARSELEDPCSPPCDCLPYGARKARRAVEEVDRSRRRSVHARARPSRDRRRVGNVRSWPARPRRRRRRAPRGLRRAAPRRSAPCAARRADCGNRRTPPWRPCRRTCGRQRGRPGGGASSR